tara:strand:- start:15 stop:620 length:606 start_codon:yes stop_codon:yes gene_type:complete
MIKKKLLFLGDGAVGKTTILHQYCNKDDIKNISSTIGIDYLTKRLKNDITLQLWDCAGQERFHSIIDSYYRNAHYIIFVFDLNNIESLLNIDKYWMDIIDARYNEINYPKIYLVGNKCDLDYNKDILYDIKTIKEKYNMNYYEVCGINNTHINKLFDSIINEIIAENTNTIIDILDTNYNPEINSTISLENNNDTFTNCKC